MSESEPRAWSRRLFMQQGVTLASIASTVPWFIQRSAEGVMHPLDSAVSSLAGVPEDRVLVVVQLGGGNDGLNTVVPYFSDDYRRARPAISIGAPGRPNGNAGEALQLDQDAGLGLQYEIAQPAVAGAVTPGSDGLGQKARAAETPESHSLNKTTRTL